MKRKLKGIIFNGQFVKYVELPPDCEVGVLLPANSGIKVLYLCKKSGHIFPSLSYNLPIQKKLVGRKEGEVCQNGYIINLSCMQIFCKKIGVINEKEKNEILHTIGKKSSLNKGLLYFLPLKI